MKNKKIISMVLAAGMFIGGTGLAPVKAMAATKDNIQVTSTNISQKDLKVQAYDLLNKIKENPTEADVKEARKLVSNISDLRFTSAYTYLLNLYVDRNIDKGISPVDELINAYTMNQSITAMEQKFGLATKLEAENLSEEEEMVMAQILPIINTLTVGLDSRMKTSDENKKVQLEGTINISMMNMPIQAKIWLDVDITGNTPKMKYIIEIPESLKMFMPPEFKDIKYFVYDLDTILKASGVNPGDLAGFGDIMKSAEVFNKKFYTSLNDFIKLADANYDIVSRGDLTSLDAETVKDLSKLYKIDLNNEKFMGIIKDALKDKSMKKIMKDYINDSMKVDPNLNGQQLTDKDLDLAVEEITKALGEIGDSIKMDMVYECGVNKEGYVSYEKGNFTVTVDTAKFKGLVPEGTPEQNGKDVEAPNSKYTFTMNFDSNLSNINKDLELAPMPEVNEKNSIDLMQLITANPGL